MSTCLYLLWRWLEFESNQWTYRSAATLGDLCENDFKSAPMARLRANRNVKGWLFHSAHHLIELLKTWTLHTNVPFTYPSTILLTRLLSVSAESTEEHFRWATCKTGLMLHPVERLGSLFPLNYSVRISAERCQSLGISDNLQGQFN